MNMKIKKFINTHLVALCILICWSAYWIYLNYREYVNFGFGGWDLSLYAQGMWSLVNGVEKPSLFGLSMFGDHATYFALLIAPFYSIFQTPLTLMWFKVLFFAIGGMFLYLIVNLWFGRLWAVLFMVAYLFYPPHPYMLLSSFNFENLSPVFIFMAFYFAFKGRFTAFVVSIILLSSIKENMPLIVVMLSFFTLFLKNSRKGLWFLTSLCIGIGFFYLQVFVITPVFRAELVNNQSNHWQLYNFLGSTPREILFNFLTKPLVIVEHIFSPRKVSFLNDLFGHLWPFACLSPHILFVALPIFLQNLLSKYAMQQTIFYYYAVTMVPFIWLAVLNTANWMRPPLRNITLLFILGIMFFHSFTKTKIDLYKPANGNIYTHYRWHMINKIPKEDGVAATKRLLPALSQRSHLYFFGRLNNPFTRKSLPLIHPEVDWVLLDLIPGNVYADRAKDFIFNHSWGVVAAMEEIILFQKDDGNKLDRIFQTSNNKFEGQQNEGIIQSPHFQLDDINVKEPRYDHPYWVLPVTCYWLVKDMVPGNHKIKIQIQDASGVVYLKTRSIGYSFFPAASWKNGSYVKEEFYYQIPRLDHGEYTLTVYVWINNKLVSTYKKPWHY